MSMPGVIGDLADSRESWRVRPGTVSESPEALRDAVGLFIVLDVLEVTELLDW